MQRRPTRITAKQSRKVSQRVNASTVGTHQAHARAGRPGKMNANDLKFSSARRSRRASAGVVGNLGTSSTTAESMRSYSQRTNARAYGQTPKAFSVLKVALVCLAVLVLVVGVGLFVASRVFFGLVGGRIVLNDDTVSAYVTAPAANTPYYALFVADLDETNNCNTDVDMVVLARMDEAGKALTCISIPAALQVTLNDGATHSLHEAVSMGGYGELVRAVAAFANVDIAHVVRLTQADIEGLVDQWGGLEWNLAEEVDDPKAGTLYIPAGQQQLNGVQTTTLLRATNFSLGTQQQGLNQCAFVAQFLQHSASGGFLDACTRLDKQSKYMHTDWPAEALISLFRAYNGFQASSAFAEQVPCYETSATATGDVGYVAYSSSWSIMMDTVEAGGNPAVGHSTAAEVDPQSFTITVRNGSGITGGAATIAQQLVNLGYKVEETGNTDSYVYTETLVIYLDDAFEPAANAVCQALNMGRVIDGTNHYLFDTDVLVVLGTDWMPQN